MSAWRAAALVLCLALVPCLPAQVTKKGKQSLFRIKWSKGKSYRYAINVATLVPGSSKVMNNPLTLSLDVLDAKGGVGTVKYALSGGPSGAEKPQTAKVDSLGRSPSTSGLSDIFVTYPQNALGVGQSYTIKQPATNTMFGKAATSMKLTFRGLRSPSGKPVAEFDVETTLKGAATSGKGNGTMTVGVADGMVVSMKQQLTIQAKSTDSKGKTQTTTLPVQLSVSLK